MITKDEWLTIIFIGLVLALIFTGLPESKIDWINRPKFKLEQIDESIQQK